MFKCKLANRTGPGQENRPFEANQPLISYVLLKKKKKALKQSENGMMVHFKHPVNAVEMNCLPRVLGFSQTLSAGSQDLTVTMSFTELYRIMAFIFCKAPTINKCVLFCQSHNP